MDLTQSTSAGSESCGCRGVDTPRRRARGPCPCTTGRKHKKFIKILLILSPSKQNVQCFMHISSARSSTNEGFLWFLLRLSWLLTIASKSTCSSTRASEISAACWKCTLSGKTQQWQHLNSQALNGGCTCWLTTDPDYPTFTKHHLMALSVCWSEGLKFHCSKKP